jgi:hypothetical protein
MFSFSAVITMSNNSSEDSENQAEVAAFIKAIEKGLIEIQEGKTLSLDEVKRRLDIDK